MPEIQTVSEETLAFLRRHMELRQEKDETEKAAKKAAEDYKDSEGELFEMLYEGPVQTLSRVDLGPPWGKVTFSARQTHFHKIIDSDALQEHFEQRAMVDELTAPKFVGKRLNEIVRDVIEQGGEGMPPGLSYRTNNGVSITRQKS